MVIRTTSFRFCHLFNCADISCYENLLAMTVLVLTLVKSKLSFSKLYNKASGGDGIPAELFQILKDAAAKVLHSICRQI